MKYTRYLTHPFIAFLAAVILFGCESSSPVVSGPLSQDASLAAKATWPPRGTEPQAVALASNLLAKNYLVVLDGSGSMQEKACYGDDSKSVISKKALVEFAKSVPQDANLGLVAFDSIGITERVPLGSGSDNRSAFTEEVEKTRADSGTPLHSAITLAYEKLVLQGRRQLGYGEYHLVVVTDGEASPPILEDPGKVVNTILAGSPVIIHTIGFCIGERHSLNQPGRTIYREATNLASLREGLKEIYAESVEFDQSYQQ